MQNNGIITHISYKPCNLIFQSTIVAMNNKNIFISHINFYNSSLNFPGPKRPWQ